VIKIKKKCGWLFFESKKLYICDRISIYTLSLLIKHHEQPDKSHGVNFTEGEVKKNIVKIFKLYKTFINLDVFFKL